MSNLTTFAYESRDCIGICTEGGTITIADVWDERYAKLFAAAPELLEALREMIEVVEEDAHLNKLGKMILNQAKQVFTKAS